MARTRKPPAPRGTVAQVKAALTRKFGPLPAWVYFVAAAVALYWWRKKHPSTASTTTTGTATSSGSLYPSTPPVIEGTGGGPGSSGGGSGSGDGSGSGSGSGGGPPPQTFPGITIWLHNPQHDASGGKLIGSSYTYTGDPSVAAWFQVDGTWYYYQPGTYSNPYTNGSVQGQAWAYNDPHLPPAAGSPPSNSQASSSSASTSQTTTTKGVVKLPIPVDLVDASVAPGAAITAGHGIVKLPIARPTVLRVSLGRTRARNWFGPPPHGHRPPPGPPNRYPGPRSGPPGPPVPEPPPVAPQSSSPAKTASAGLSTPGMQAGVGRIRRPGTATGVANLGDRGRPRGQAAYDPSQIPSNPDPLSSAGTALAVAPAQAAAGRHLQGAVERSQARSAAAQAQAPPARAAAARTPQARPPRSNLSGAPATGRVRGGTGLSAKASKPRGAPPGGSSSGRGSRAGV